MAEVNLPELKLPSKLAEDPELRPYFEYMAFTIYQLWQRTGGGSDTIEGDGLDILALQKTFSWKTIPVNNAITIAVNQQMAVSSGIVINGDLILEGDLALI